MLLLQYSKSKQNIGAKFSLITIENPDMRRNSLHKPVVTVIERSIENSITLSIELYSLIV